MLQSLRNRRNRKGFTLAELLIVIAIIAVLVAIAVPLFVGALDNAREQVFDGNKRSLKSIGVAQILLDQDKYLKLEDETNGWDVTGTVSSTGDVTITAIVAGTGNETQWSAVKGSYEAGKTPITVTVTRTDMKALG